MKNSLATARSRVPAQAQEADSEDEEEAPVARAAGQQPGGGGGFGGLGGFPGMGGGGMPDIGEMMKNPALMQMAQSSKSGVG